MDIMQNPSAPIFFHDPGHGWLRVPVAELNELAIADQVSAYSYVDPDRTCAFLEEDCDMALYLKAKPDFKVGDITSIYDEDERVRNLPRFSFNR